MSEAKSSTAAPVTATAAASTATSAAPVSASVAAAVSAAASAAAKPKPKGLDRLKGRAAIITGGSDGIGFGIASVFVREGARVLITGRDAAKGAAAAAAIALNAPDGTGAGTVTFVKSDAAVQKEAEAVVAAALKAFGRLDIVVANAGVMPVHPLDTVTVEQWDEVMAINVRGVMLAVKTALPHFTAQKYGKFVCTSSITGPITGLPRMSSYGASKAAIEGFIRSAAIELAKHAITINAVTPGNILTPSLAALSPEYVRDARACIPTGDLGTPEDIGYAVLFLSTDESKFVTGTSIVVDGGQTLPESLDIG